MMWTEAERRKTMILYRTLALTIAVFATTEVSGELVINEMMINEPESHTTLEWVELFNRGDRACDLSDYLFVEAEDTTRFESVIVPAGGYILLARKVIADEDNLSFEGWWGDSSGVWGDGAAEDYPVVGVTMSLRNSGDAVELIEIDSNRVERVAWGSSPPDGISLERKNPVLDADVAGFDHCIAETGSTPGRVNSIIAPGVDLGIKIDSIETTHSEGDTIGIIKFQGRVRNMGLNSLPASEVMAFLDKDLSEDLTAADSVWYLDLPESNPGDSFSYNSTIVTAIGRTALSLRLPADDDPSNNIFDTTFALGEYFSELVINELQLSSGFDNGREWIELMNMTGYRLDLSGFRIGPPDLGIGITDSVLIESGERILLCQDTTTLRQVAPEIICRMIELTPWVGLDDGGGELQVISDLNTLSDGIAYAGMPDIGVSWERDADTTGVSFEALFYPSSDPFGSTPCGENSVRILPPAFDLAFLPDSISREYVSDEMNQLKVEAMVANIGLEPVFDANLLVFDDVNFNGVPEAGEQIRELEISEIGAGERLRQGIELRLARGYHDLIWKLSADENEDNNMLTFGCSFGPITGEVIVTEFLANPEDELNCEWVELQNVSSRKINLKDWRLGDAIRLHEIEDDIMLRPHEYLVLAEANNCGGMFDEHGCVPVTISGWSALNNSGDLIELRDQFGVVADSFTYSLTAGENRSIELNEDAYTAGRRIWYPSTAILGATPCENNSVSGPEDAPIAVTLEKPVFSPASGEQLRLDVSCPPATSLTIEVFDLAGRRHFTLAHQQTFSPSTIYYSGGSDIMGQLCAGAYILMIKGGDGDDFADKIGFAVAPPR